MEKAGQEDKELVMKFGAQWCAPCKRMDEETWSNEDVASQMASNNVFHKVDIDQNPDLAEKYGITGVPVTLIGKVSKDSDGNYVFTPTQTISGFMNADDMLDKLKR